MLEDEDRLAEDDLRGVMSLLLLLLPEDEYEGVGLAIGDKLRDSWWLGLSSCLGLKRW